MPLSIPSFIISIVLFLVLFFGIGFLLNMLFRSSWIMAVLFPLVAIYIINNAKLIQYVKNPSATFGQIGDNFINLAVADIVILSSGFIGAIASGITIKMLRKKGYQMF
ncbi:YuiB family protein [Bacillus sp. AGMB 02131]|uniref:YuiB family protein n=1 Tax=Peribacillus faecalis TaxID=2772559 RepID=A0A927CWU4_9BACI|nr:YuiB family protein [Peribacillus faecalis]MBD3109036.1 YuiB family protein [Peribacillus faecalis]